MVQPWERAEGAAGAAKLSAAAPGLRSGAGSGGAAVWVLLPAAVWLVGFQCLFYAQSFVDPDVYRSQLWLMLLYVNLILHYMTPSCPSLLMSFQQQSLVQFRSIA